MSDQSTRDMNPGVSLTPAQLDEVRPFYVLLDAQLRVAQVGRSLSRLYPDVVPGTLISEKFRLDQQGVDWSWASLRKNAGRLLLLRHAKSPIMLRAQFVVRAEDQGGILLASPWITTEEELHNSGLTIDDFPVHEPWFDLIQLHQVQLNANRDLDSMNARLLAQREELRTITERLKIANNSAEIGVWDYNILTNELVWDEKMFAIYGLSREQFSGAYDAWEAGLHPEDKLRTVAELTAAIKGSATFDTEFRVIWPDGSVHYIKASANVLHDATGKPTQMIGINLDITKRRLVELDLLRLKGSLDEVHDCVFLFDPTTLQFFYANKGAEHQTGYTSGQLLHLHPYDLTPEYPEPLFRKLIQPLIDGTKSSLRFETIHRRKDGQTIPVEVLIQYINTNPKAPHFVNILTDISERKSAEALTKKEARQTELILKTASDGIHILDSAGNVLRANDAFADSLGYTLEEVEKLNVRDWDANIPALEIQAVLDGLFAKNTSQNFETLHRRKNGDVIDVEVSARAVDIDGRRILYASSRNISARKIEQREKVQIIDSTPNGLVMVDHKGIICLANAAIEKMFAYDRTELIGKSIETLVPQRVRDQHIKDRTAYSEAPQARPMGGNRDLFGRRKDGSEFACEIGLNTVSTVDGEMILASVLDITERKKNESSIQKLLDDLGRSNADLEQFAYVASHDLQEPLRAVAGCLELLRMECSGKIDAAGVELIAHAVEGAQRMRTLISDLLHFSRISSRGKPMSQTDLNSVLDNVLVDLAIAVEESGAQITRDQLPLVMGDASQLYHLLQNLVGNAIKFRGAKSPEIHVSAERQHSIWTVSVRDNGIGIDMKYADRIFVIFQRLHTRREYSGTGIGLAVCKKIVERHGGRLWVESEVGKGSTFKFTLNACEQIKL
jgi:PAS domain S-box-containing protein